MRALLFSALLAIATLLGTSAVRADSSTDLHRADTVRVAWHRGWHYGWQGRAAWARGGPWYARRWYYPAYSAYYPAYAWPYYSSLYAPGYYDYYYSTPYGYTVDYGTPYGSYYWTWRY